MWFYAKMDNFFRFNKLFIYRIIVLELASNK